MKNTIHRYKIYQKLRQLLNKALNITKIEKLDISGDRN